MKHSKSNRRKLLNFTALCPPAEEIAVSLAGFNSLRYQAIDTVSVFWAALSLSLITLLGQVFSIPQRLDLLTSLYLMYGFLMTDSLIHFQRAFLG